MTKISLSMDMRLSLLVIKQYCQLKGMSRAVWNWLGKEIKVHTDLRVFKSSFEEKNSYPLGILSLCVLYSSFHLSSGAKTLASPPVVIISHTIAKPKIIIFFFNVMNYLGNTLRKVTYIQLNFLSPAKRHWALKGALPNLAVIVSLLLCIQGFPLQASSF